MWGGHHPEATKGLESWIAIALGLLLYTTFCQVPFLQLRQAFRHRRFMVALMFANFVIVPGVVWLLVHSRVSYCRFTCGSLPMGKSTVRSIHLPFSRHFWF
ncbi:hypothetical protein [Leptodesmis sichuanensis]|uniref:hypothetical protein n=1 Tax=Leptodesmis sichuanensis TaxID=2906798 RepID=UPI001F1F2DDE|nr:hypothetical protein [Leptodesmis sichuanensis]UIE37214.1 hypothetical protein KIK02_19970 [Leptodesmis sichuanensis A121]